MQELKTTNKSYNISGIAKSDDGKLINEGDYNVRVKLPGMKRAIVLRKGESVLIINGKAKKL